MGNYLDMYIYNAGSASTGNKTGYTEVPRKDEEANVT